ncbi:hypothetical protein TKK_0009104 [Trichogramma kaykai]|uniref:Uncharacterized protein n=1 Tax=Trichogramma kaykai TaxID=54128 RepID=A0ABD2X4K0_9HYME
MKQRQALPIFLAVVASASLSSEFFANAVNSHGCDLKYKKHVEDRPNFFLMTNSLPGICHIQHENSSQTNYHVDRKYAEQIRPESVVGGLNYDARNGTLIYWAKIANVDHSRLYKVRLNDTNWESILDQDDDFRDVAYDWVTKNLYIIMGVRSLMIAVNAENPWNPTVVIHDRSQLTTLAVHPNKGYLFFVEKSFWYGVQNKILRAHLDGSNIVEFQRPKQESRYHIASMVVDFHGDRLYWSLPGKNRIQHSNLDGKDVRTIGGVRVYYGQSDLSSKTIAIDKHYVYYKAAESNTVRRIEKSSEIPDTDYELVNDEEAPITEIVAVAYKSQKIRKDHPCKDNRGGCEKYCFAVPSGGPTDSLRRVCKCSFNDVLEADGANCSRKQAFTV